MLNKKIKLFNRGFTLLELLVVIGIIAILIALGAVSYSSAQKKARDTKRKSDMKDIQNALEQYYSVCGFSYPNPDSGKVPSQINCATPVVQILQNAPTDPKLGSTNGRYEMTQPDGTSSTYQICATLETETVPQYCVSNQQ